MGHPPGRGVTKYAVAGSEHGGKGDEVRRGHAIDDECGMLRRVAAHVLQRQGLGMPFEALEERHVARKMRRVLGGEAPAAIHSGKIVNAVFTHPAYSVAHHLARAQHAAHLLVRALHIDPRA